MEEYNAQFAEGLRQDYEFLKARIETMQQWLRENPGHEEDPEDTSEASLFWLVTLRAKEYGITPPEPTIVSTYLAAKEVARETKRLHSQQMIALIRQNINRKDSK